MGSTRIWLLWYLLMRSCLLLLLLWFVCWDFGFLVSWFLGSEEESLIMELFLLVFFALLFSFLVTVEGNLTAKKWIYNSLFFLFLFQCGGMWCFVVSTLPVSMKVMHAWFDWLAELSFACMYACHVAIFFFGGPRGWVCHCSLSLFVCRSKPKKRSVITASFLFCGLDMIWSAPGLARCFSTIGFFTPKISRWHHPARLTWLNFLSVVPFLASFFYTPLCHSRLFTKYAGLELWYINDCLRSGKKIFFNMFVEFCIVTQQRPNGIVNLISKVSQAWTFEILYSYRVVRMYDFSLSRFTVLY